METKIFFIKNNRTKLNILKLLIISLFLFIIISMLIIAEEKPGTVLLGDFIVTLINLEREGDIANLEFSVTKVGNSNSGCQSLVVYLIDDHENEYNGSLSVDLENAPDVVLNALPKGFTYVDKVDIPMPKVAPIVKIRLKDREVLFKDVKLGQQPQFMTDFGDLAITRGQSVPLGKWLSFTIEQAVPELPTWKLPVTIENKEYNSLPADVRLGVQNRDGTISWCGSITTGIPALSKTLVSLSLVFKETPPQPRVLMLQYIDKKAQEHVLKIFPMPPGKLLPFAVAGKIYEKWKGGSFKLGLPIGDEQSASVSGAQGSSASGRFQSFERGRIYVITSGAQAGRVVAISGVAYNEYSRLNFEASWLGFPNTDQYANIFGLQVANFENGYITSPDGKSWQGFPYEKGRIAFVTDRDGNQEIYVMDASGLNEVNLSHNQADDYAPEWSPDGSKIAFVSIRSGKPEIYIMSTISNEVDRVSNTEGALSVTWLSDGNRIAFTVRRSYYWRGQVGEKIFIVDINGTNRVQLAEHSGFEGDGVAVSPDSRQMAYGVGTLGLGELRIMGADGKSLREFSFKGTPAHPAWSPNGKYIAVCGAIVYATNGATKTLLPKVGGHPSWSSDGKAIALDTGGQGDIQIVHVDAKIGREIQGKGNNWDPSWLKATKLNY
jgi:TolB protein